MRYPPRRPPRRVAPRPKHKVIQIAGKRGYKVVTPFTSNLDNFISNPVYQLTKSMRYPPRRHPRRVAPLQKHKVIQIAGKRGYKVVTPFTSNLDNFICNPVDQLPM